MTSTTTRITIRLGNLAKPLKQAANEAGVSQIQWVKQAIADALGVELEHYTGNMQIGALAKQAAEKRWSKKSPAGSKLAHTPKKTSKKKPKK